MSKKESNIRPENAVKLKPPPWPPSLSKRKRSAFKRTNLIDEDINFIKALIKKEKRKIEFSKKLSKKLIKKLNKEIVLQDEEINLLCFKSNWGMKMRVDQVLDLKIKDSVLGESVSIRKYLKSILVELIEQGESFSGKRPFGDSDWLNDLYGPLADVGLIDRSNNHGEISYDSFEADKIIVQLIKGL